MLQKESGSCLILLNKYLEQLNKISLHQFMKIWQLKQFNISLQNEILNFLIRRNSVFMRTFWVWGGLI